ncbi:hypothetical protein GS3922_02410 [Geobacillus subterraneus]|uniref:Mce/MlaD domain-containing protein n=2 Tax=Geobacillus TaxID=129337 RepID=A0ABN4NDI9_9BACL|nr:MULTISPECIES: hypothetical protein [Geobacillus]AMX82616.1 hypothetical protein GS3922_02410 [Geobacillus subterraneus]KZS26302.1 hypothetical protein A5418_15720 [Geobacillus subterraneus]OXB90707.1 hypothetical protein B9L21_02215 [Geobacillus uzenensis]QOR83670.1 hypothetical protein IMZ17_13980 [Geobacillus stearothermophilus]
MKSSKWLKTALLALTLLLCLPLGGARSLAAGEEQGFVIHADKVVGILDLGGIVLGSPKVIVGKLPIAFIQADISGLSMERAIDTPQGTIMLSIRSEGTARATWMKLDVTKLKFGGLCFDGFPIKQCLKDVTLVATKMTASRLAIPDMSLSASFSGASMMQAERSALEQTDLAQEVERLIWQLDEQKQGSNSAARMVKTLQTDIPTLEKHVKSRMDEWTAMEEKQTAVSASLEPLEQAMTGEQIAGSEERTQYEAVVMRFQEWKQMLERQSVALSEDVVKWNEQDALWEKAASYAAKSLKLGEQSNAMSILSDLRSSLDGIKQQLDKQKEAKAVWSQTVNEFEKRLDAVEEWLKRKPAAGEKSTAGRSDLPLSSPRTDGEATP